MGAIPVVAGLDIHSAVIVACMRRRKGEEVRSFATTRSALAEMKAWLARAHCTTVGMEATGVYWRPIHQALEGTMAVLVANPQHIKVMKGRKTDKADAAWIASKVADGGMPSSFIPAPQIRGMRDLARLRDNVVRAHVQVRNQIHKLLAGAGVPLSAVLSDIFGPSGMVLLRQMATGRSAWDGLEGMVSKQLIPKLQQLRLALEMPLTEAQCWELRFQLQRLDQITAELAQVEALLEQRLAPFEEVRARLITIPGIGRQAAGLLIAYLGVDLSGFPTAKHFAAWIGLAPGMNETAGKQRPVGTRKGHPALRTLLVQCAHATARANHSWLQHKYKSLKGRMWPQKAIVAIAHKLAVIAYHVIKDGGIYQDQGTEYQAGERKRKALRKAVKLIQSMGGSVSLPDILPPSKAAESPTTSKCASLKGGSTG